MFNHPASLTDEEVEEIWNQCMKDGLVWATSDVSRYVADVATIKALEWSADFLESYRKDLPEWDVTRSTLLQGENALRRAIKSSSPE